MRYAGIYKKVHRGDVLFVAVMEMKLKVKNTDARRRIFTFLPSLLVSCTPDIVK